MRFPTLIAALLFVTTLLCQRSAAPAAPAIAVIAHPSTGNRCLSVDELEAMYLLSKRRWNNGQRAIPLNYPPKHSIRRRFDQAVLNMTADEVAKHWINERIRGGPRPPRHVPNGELMARVVPRLKGSLGYVPMNQVPKGVSVVGVVVGGRVKKSRTCR